MWCRYLVLWVAVNLRGKLNFATVTLSAIVQFSPMGISCFILCSVILQIFMTLEERVLVNFPKTIIYYTIINLTWVNIGMEGILRPEYSIEAASWFGSWIVPENGFVFYSPPFHQMSNFCFAFNPMDSTRQFHSKIDVPVALNNDLILLPT